MDLNRIVIDPKILVGKPIIRGTRLSVDFILDLMAQGWNEAEILRNYPSIGREDILASRSDSGSFHSASVQTWGAYLRTGDSGRWLSDGNIECLGRSDDQIKIRGYRIEPGEIEASLKKHPAIREAVVVAKDRDSTIRELAAYFISTQDLGISQLREFAGRFLPEYMIPTGLSDLRNFP